MALKGDRFEGITSIEFFMNEVAERGGVVVSSTGANVAGGSGAALDQWKSQVTYAAAGSVGRYPVGVLLNDMVNLDLTKQHINWQRNQMQIGSKVTLLREGWVVTNMIDPAAAPALGSGAYLSNSGLFTTVVGSNAKVGRFESAADGDGFAKVYVKLPQ